MQYVGVEFRTGPNRVYAYQWGGEAKLEIGQRVVVPANWNNPIPSFADVKVVYQGRESVPFKGPLADIMGLVMEDG